MKRIRVEYVAQMRAAADGVDAETFEVEDDADLVALLRAAADRHGENLESLLFDESGAPRASSLVFVNGDQVDWSEPPSLQEGAVVTLLAPLAGG